MLCHEGTARRCLCAPALSAGMSGIQGLDLQHIPRHSRRSFCRNAACAAQTSAEYEAFKKSTWLPTEPAFRSGKDDKLWTSVSVSDASKTRGMILIGFTYNCAANSRLILATCSLLQSMSSSAWSPLCFLLLGLMGGGPVLWLLTADDRDMACILDSPLSAASPTANTREPALIHVKHLLQEAFVGHVRSLLHALESHFTRVFFRIYQQACQCTGVYIV